MFDKMLPEVIVWINATYISQFFLNFFFSSTFKKNIKIAVQNYPTFFSHDSRNSIPEWFKQKKLVIDT